MGQVSPIVPVPAWFFDILTSESKDMARVISSFIQKSLEDNEKEVPASFKDIAQWTGLVPDRISASILALREKGYLRRTKEGKFDQSGKKTKAVYAVNWDCKEQGTELRVRQVYRHINSKYDVAEASPEVDGEGTHISQNIHKLVPKRGEKVRVGRFGDESNGRAWFRIGFKALEEEQAKGPVGVMLRKIADGKIDELTPRDLLSFWEYSYQKKYLTPYIPVLGKDLGIFSRLLKIGFKGDSKPVLRLIRYLFESGQDKIQRPNVGILGSRWVTELNTKAREWAALERERGRN